MTSPEAEDTELRPSEWWARQKAQQHPWTVPTLPQKRPSRNNRGLYTIVAGVVVLLAVGGILLAVNSGGSSDTSAAAAPSTSAKPAPPRATVPGWQVVVNAVPDDAVASGADGTVAVDVPANWTVAPVAGTDGLASVRASVGDGVCPNVPASRRAVVTQTADSTADQSKAVANIVAGVLHDTGYANFRPQLNVAAPRATADGTYRDYRVTVALAAPPPPPPGPPGAPPPVTCVPVAEVVHVVAKAHNGGTFAVVVAGDQQVAGAIAPAELDKIAATVRTP